MPPPAVGSTPPGVNPGEVIWDGRSDVGPWSGPKSANERGKLQQAEYAPIMSRSAVRGIRPPLAQIRANPKRFGYDHTPLGISDIIEITRDYTPRIDWSGGIGAYEATSRNALGAM